MILKEFTVNGQVAFKKISATLAENYNYVLDYKTMTQTRAMKMRRIAEQRYNTQTKLDDRIKYRLIAESLDLWMQANIQTELTSMVAEGIDDDSMEEAKVILAAKELSDKIQGMIEDAAKMQVQDLLPIVDAMKTEIGSSEADAFASAAETAMAGLVDALKNSKSEYDNAIGIAQGQTPASDMDGMGDMDGMDDMDGIDDMDGMDDMGDEFDGDAAAAGTADPVGRELKDEI